VATTMPATNAPTAAKRRVNIPGNIAICFFDFTRS
jgi:hypothetical protein